MILQELMGLFVDRYICYVVSLSATNVVCNMTSVSVKEVTNFLTFYQLHNQI